MFLEIKKKEKEALQADSKVARLTPDRGSSSFNKRSTQYDDNRKRQYREHEDDTPSHGGGVNTSAKLAIDDRYHKSRRVDYSSNKDDRKRSYEDDYHRNRDRYNRDRGRDRDHDKDRYRYKDHERNRDRRDDRRSNDREKGDSSRSYRSSRDSGDRRHSSRRGDTSVRFRDEPLTPALSVVSTPGRKGWDDDDSGYGTKRSSQWDFPTPVPENQSRKDDETPLPTPVHKFNPWVRQPGSSHLLQTPGFVKNKASGEKGDGEEVQVDKDEWEDEQKRLDREWYNMDEGYDDVHNPFAGISDDYTKKKEEQLAQRKHQRMSAQQRQINRDNELWEKNRLLTSGVVMNVDGSEDYEEDNEARVHLLVHNIVPPFLDGRIVFTKQFEPVVPVRVSFKYTVEFIVFGNMIHHLHNSYCLSWFGYKRTQLQIWPLLLGRVALLFGNSGNRRKERKLRKNTGSLQERN